MEPFLIGLGIATVAMLVGIFLTIQYFKAAISVYNSVMRGDYTMLLVEPGNPRLMDAGAILMQGKIEAALAAVEEAEEKPKFEVIKGGEECD